MIRTALHLFLITTLALSSNFAFGQITVQAQSGTRSVTVKGSVYEDGIPVSGADVYCLYTTSDSPNEWKDIKTTSDGAGKFECKNVPVAPDTKEIPVVAQKGDEWCDAKATVSSSGSPAPVSLNLDVDKSGTSVVEATVEKDSKDNSIKVGLSRVYPKAGGAIESIVKESNPITAARVVVTFSSLPAGYYQVRILGSQNSNTKCSVEKVTLNGKDTKKVDMNGTLLVTYY